MTARKAKWKVPLDALVASARNPTKAYTATVAPKPDDAMAQAWEIYENVHAEWASTGSGFVSVLVKGIADALRAERTRALEDAAEMCERDILGGYGHGAARDIRALKEKP